jgi:AraC-like DNA-binding protein
VQLRRPPGRAGVPRRRILCTNVSRPPTADLTVLVAPIRWWHVVALFGAVQALVFAIPLLARQRNRVANRMLAAAFVAFALHLASIAYYGAELIAQAPLFFGVGHPMPLLFGPLVYGYARAASDRAWRPTVRDAWHLLPAIVVTLWSSPFFLLSPAEKVALVHAIQRGDGPTSIALADALKLVSGAAYAVATLRLLRRHRAEMRDNYSSLDRVMLDWLRWLAYAGAVIWGLAVLFQLAEPLRVVPSTAGDATIAVMMTALVYVVADRGLRQPEIFHFAPTPPRPPAEPVADEPGEPSEDAERTPGPARPGLTPRRARALEAALRDLMVRDEPWRDPELTLGALAERLGTTTHKLSEVLNASVRMSFYDFVNGYRVRDVQRRLADPASASRTLVALALDAGFASKSTFNAVFKRATGRTPTQYRASAEPPVEIARSKTSDPIASDV